MTHPEVNTLIEHLSDGVLELVLSVVALQKTNSDIPHDLPLAISTLNKTSISMANVSQKLALTKYKPFPLVAEKMLNSSNSLLTASSQLTKSLSVESKAEKNDRWNELMNCCRIIADNTIHLLKIVYSADLESICILADSSLDKLAKIDPSENNIVDSIPFIMSALSEAQKLSNSLQLFSEDQESSYAKKDLADFSNQLTSNVQQVVDQLNHCDFSKPEDQNNLSNGLHDTEDTITNAMKYIQSIEAEPLPISDKALTTLSSALAKSQGIYGDHHSKLDSLIDESKQSSIDPIIDDDIKQLKDMLHSIEDAVLSGASENLQNILENKEEIVKKLKEDLNNVMDVVGQEKKDRIINNIALVEYPYPTEALGSKDLGDAAKENAILNLNENIGNVLHQLRDDAELKELEELVTRGNFLANKLKNSLKEKAATKTPISASDLAELEELKNVTRAIKNNLLQEAKRSDDPAHIHEVIEKVNNLEKCLDDLVKNCASPLAHQIIDGYQQELDHLPHSRDNFLSDLSNILSDSIALDNAAGFNLKEALSRQLENLKKTSEKCKESGKRFVMQPSWFKSPEQQQKSQRAIEELEKRIKAKNQIIIDYLKMPDEVDHNQLMRRLKIAQGPLEDAVDCLMEHIQGDASRVQLESDLQPIDFESLDNLCWSLYENAGDALVNAIDDLNPKDPQSLASLPSSMSRFEDLINSISSALNNVSTDLDDHIQSHIAEVLPIIDMIDKLSESPSENSSIIVNTSDHLVKAINGLEHAILNSAEERLDEGGKDLDHVKGQNDRINSALTNVLKSVQDVLYDKEDVSKGRDELRKACDSLKSEINHAEHETSKSLGMNEKSIRDQKQVIKNVLSSIPQVVKSYPNLAEKKLNQLENATRKLVRSRAATSSNMKYADKKATNQGLNEFFKLFKKIGHKSHEAVQNPNNLQAQEELKHLSEEMSSKLDDDPRLSSPFNDKIAMMQDIIDSCGNLEYGIHHGDYPLIKEEVKNFLTHSANLESLANASEQSLGTNDYLIRQKLHQNNDRIKDLIKMTSEALKDPNNLGKRQALYHSINQARLAAGEAITQMYKSGDRHLIPRGIVAQRILDAQVSMSSPDHVERAKFVGKCRAAIDAAHDYSKNNPSQSAFIQNAIKKLQNPLHKLERAIETDPEALSSLVHRPFNELRQGLENLNRSVQHDPIVNAESLKGDLAFKLKHLQDDVAQFNSGSNSVDIKKLQRDGDGIVDSAITLQCALKRLRKHAHTDSEQDSISVVVRDTRLASNPDLKDLIQRLEAQRRDDSDLAKQSNLSQGDRAVGHAIDSVALNITNDISRLSQSSKSSAAGSNILIAKELHLLSQAVRLGDRQTMQNSLKSFSLLIKDLASQLRAVAAKVITKKPREYDTLLRTAVALENTCTQFKILGSVKVASVENSTDNDDSIISMVNIIGKLLKQSLVMDMVQEVIIKEPIASNQ